MVKLPKLYTCMNINGSITISEGITCNTHGMTIKYRNICFIEHFVLVTDFMKCNR